MMNEYPPNFGSRPTLSTCKRSQGKLELTGLSEIVEESFFLGDFARKQDKNY